MLLAGVTSLAFAQQSPPASPPAAAAPASPVPLPPVVVTGNPLGSDLFEMVPPVSTLEGPRLEQNRQPTLGEMLNTLPGVNSTYFGPNASRPVIRGFEGDRIRILQNGIGILDASATSPDHAVPVDTLTVKRVEVVRGPATLLYGPSALGGVVNVIDNRIPDAALEGVTGGVDFHYASPSNERGGAVTSDVGTGGLVLHGEYSKVRTDDLKIPGFARSPQLRAMDPRPPDEEHFGTLPNSASDTTAPSGP